MQTKQTVDRVIELEAGRFHLRDTGDPGAQPLLMLHGIMGHSREWDTLVNRINERFRVIVPDQRGHGESDWIHPYTASAMSDDVVALTHQLNLPSISIVGHSMGAMVSLLTAARQPSLVERVVSIDIGPDSLSSGFAREAVPWMKEMALARYDTVEEAFQLWASGDPRARADLLWNYVEHCLVPDGQGRLRWKFDAHGLVDFFTDGTTENELWEAIDSIASPTLVVRGENSHVFSETTMGEMVNRLAHGESLVVPGGGHDLGVQQPEPIAEAILDFMNERRYPLTRRSPNEHHPAWM